MFLDNFFLKLQNNKFELNTFYLGILFLPSLPSISLIFLLFIVISLSLKNYIFWKDAFNFPLIISSLLILQSCISNTFAPNKLYEGLYDVNQIWLNYSNDKHDQGENPESEVNDDLLQIPAFLRRQAN